MTEPMQWVATVVVFVVLVAVAAFTAMARFLKRPSPSEALMRIGSTRTEVFIGRATWIVPVLHKAATLSLSTIGLTIRRAGHEASITKDYISTNLSAEFYIRVEPNEDDVKKAARTLGIDVGYATPDAVRVKAQQLLEPKLVGALRAVAAQSDFLSLHLNREAFAQEVSSALREDLGRNGFTLESVTITELTQTPLSEMRDDDIFGTSGRETVTTTVVAKNLSVRRKMQEEAERTAEIDKDQAITVAKHARALREGRATEEVAGVKAEIAQKEAIETRDLQRQAMIAVETSKKEQAEEAANIGKQKAIEAALLDKQTTIEAAEVDKQITLILKAKEAAEAQAQKAKALALKETADQEVITVGKVAEAERQKRVAVVEAEKQSEQEKIGTQVLAYQKAVQAEAVAKADKVAAEGRADASRAEAQGAADAVRIRAKAEAEAAELQASAITRLAEARREEGLKEAEVARENVAAQNGKTPEVLLAELVHAMIEKAPDVVRELVKPAERIGEIKVLQIAGGGMAGLTGHGSNGGSQPLGQALGPVAQTILESSAVLPVVHELLRFGDADQIAKALAKVAPGLSKPFEQLGRARDGRESAAPLVESTSRVEASLGASDDAA